MTADERHRTDDQHDGSSSWWWGMGPMGAVGLIVFGIAAAGWSALGMPGSASDDDRTVDSYQAARVIAIGMVVAGTALLGRLRHRATRTDQAEERDGH
ncbi:hypothetical protein [Streptomyces sp. S465]|uniref:hypothetical protein n=1 Tax=Streptomyces sp. S465 TaxID=2979468 RepID=UPI0022A8348D|nr:hypothetical protein [Streptomyces sp. S465]WAP59637.1 hypothetical protein N6H00_34435 [Streptomyces sp. S465]